MINTTRKNLEFAAPPPAFHSFAAVMTSEGKGWERPAGQLCIAKALNEAHSGWRIIERRVLADFQPRRDFTFS